MLIDEFRDYCLSKKWTDEKTPFGPDVLVLRVGEKMFALCGFDSQPFRANLKCDPEWAIELREQYAQVTPGYHMSKVHWNTVVLEELDQKLCKQLIDHSYDLIVNSLPKKLLRALEQNG